MRRYADLRLERAEHVVVEAVGCQRWSSRAYSSSTAGTPTVRSYSAPRVTVNAEISSATPNLDS